MRLLLSALVFLSLAVALPQATAQQNGKVVVYPMEAVLDSAKLSHGDYKRRYPGIDVTNFGLTDEGWYIRYAHEQLVYMFGPSDDLDLTREMKAALEEIRLAAVLKNPKLSSSKIDIVRFEFGNSPSAAPVEIPLEDNPYLKPGLEDSAGFRRR